VAALTVPLLRRVVEVRVDLGAGQHPQYRFGSGFRLGGRVVLTAAHVVVGAPSGSVTVCGPDKVRHDVTTVKGCVGDQAAVDLALLELPKDIAALPTVAAAVVDIDAAVPDLVEDCWAVGYPEFKEISTPEGPVRETAQASGVIPPGSNLVSGFLSLQVMDPPRALPPQAMALGKSPWAGMSGAAVFAGDQLVGVVAEHAPREGDATITVTPLTFIDRLGPEIAVRWWSLLGVADPAALPRLPTSPGRPEPSYEGQRSPDEYFVDVPPLRSGGLVGRDDLMARAVDLLIHGEDGIHGEDVALVGLGGAGKSALASGLVRDESVRSFFRAGIFWLSVGRTKDGSSAWHLKLINWARELHMPQDQIMEASRMGAQSLVDLVDGGLGAARMLLIFDDVWDESEALLFKGLGKECRRILTTRIDSVGSVFSAAGFLRVDDLADSEARELFGRLAPAVLRLRPDIASTAIPVIGRLPLVLVIAASYLQARVIDDPVCLDEALASVLDVNQRFKLAPHMSKSSTTDALGDTPATLEAVIDLSAGSLPTDDRHALTSLAAFPPKLNSFSRDAAQVVATSWEAVRTLHRYSLVEDLDAGRLTMHQTIHDYAVHGTEGDQDAYRRMAEYFLTFISEQQKNANAEEWLTALEQEKDNIRAALEWAMAREETLLAYQLMSALWDYWYRRSHYAIARDLADRILALHLTDTTGSAQLLRAKLLNDTGNFAYNMADLEQAERRHRQALEIRQKLANDSVAGSWNNLGLVYRERGDYVRAGHFFNKALDRNRAMKNKYWEALNLDNIGINARCLHHLKTSEKILREAAAIFADLEDPWGAAMAQIDLALTLVARGSLKEARKLLTSSLSDRWSAKDQKLSAAALRGLAAISSAEHRSESSLNLLNASLALSVPILDRLGEHQSLFAMISVYGNRGDHHAVARIFGILGALHASTGLASLLDETATAKIVSDARSSLGQEFKELASEGRAAAIAKDGVLDLENSVKPLLEDVNAEAIVTKVFAEESGSVT
jgi:tetratricopeptide (TPR) repeat protein